ncbi:hypothetical protein E2562_031522 [Oryza meyeriana var. granulata]|uniref:Uncharacterized protein n=1 Tax=Oryza meyeriana var. granulata TaxID=110450 RepID=A0A6G1DQU4_9ORYZ|nr:hypothetical protein E2562_031522 [Oryza meyeriana var. granulata]
MDFCDDAFRKDMTPNCIVIVSPIARPAPLVSCRQQPPNGLPLPWRVSSWAGPDPVNPHTEGTNKPPHVTGQPPTGHPCWCYCPHGPLPPAITGKPSPGGSQWVSAWAASKPATGQPPDEARALVASLLTGCLDSRH